MAQWGFVGPAYEAANPAMDSQRLINWYVETDSNQNSPTAPGIVKAESKTALGLLGAPGLISLSTAFTGEFRGSWPLPGNKQALFVIGSSLVLATITTPATQTANAVLAFTSVGLLQTVTGPVKIRDNGAGGIAAIVDGPFLYIYTVASGVFFRSTDSAFLGSDTISEIDGWFFFQKPGSQVFYSSPEYWNGTDPMDGTYFALKDDSSDNLVAIIENNRQLWLIGEATTEPWYNAGGSYFPLSRLEGGLMQIGCSAAHSVCRSGPNLIWLARSERGENSVVLIQGYQYTVISTPALSYALTQYPVIADARAYIYSEEGHEFYVLTFPTADATWVYDLTTALWHQRASFDPVAGQFHRNRVNALCNFAGMRIGGDYQTGAIYQQTRKAFDDAGQPLVCVRRAPHVWDKSDRNRVMHARLQIEFFSGSGLSSGQGSDPQAMLKWSNDGGQTWGNEHWTTIGQIGQTLARAIWRRLGSARDRVYELTFSDPVKRDIVGASLQAGGTGA